MSDAKFYLGDCRDILKQIPDNSIDSVVTDPPYELGFMGKQWDSKGVAYDISLWKEVFRVLKPGAHLLAFGGTRTYHRMACAIEDAGFEIRDMVGWIYGQGFPKSFNIGKQSGCEQWDGWGTALKPAHEPICLARKPISEKTIVENVLKWGVGGLNIDGCRIELNGEIVPINKLEDWSGFGQLKQPDYEQEINSKGRFPANLIFDEEAGAMLDKQSGMVGGGNKVKLNSEIKRTIINTDKGGGRGIVEGRLNKTDSVATYPDKGGASRFFYCPKASGDERNAGLEDMEKKENLQGLDVRGRTLIREDGTKTLVERRKSQPSQNNHPTVKPINLMRYLCRLVTPSNGVVLDPFMGSGTTGCAAVLEGFSFVGIDYESDYVEIARRRIEYCNRNVGEKRLNGLQQKLPIMEQPCNH